jgi:hypothetical protein
MISADVATRLGCDAVVISGKYTEDRRRGRGAAVLLAAKRRGLSAGEWARAHDIDGRSLNAWLTCLVSSDQGLLGAEQVSHKKHGDLSVVTIQKQTAPGENALDATHVYWTNLIGSVERRARAMVTP